MYWFSKCVSFYLIDCPYCYFLLYYQFPLSRSNLGARQSDSSIKLRERCPQPLGSTQPFSPIQSQNDLSKLDPAIVVISTANTTIVMTKSLFDPQTCNASAKAITPLTIPEYQQTFNYSFFKGKTLFRMQYIPGSIYTIAPLITGKNSRINIAKPTAKPFPEIPSRDAPRQAQTNASAIQLTVSKAKPVPLCDSSDIFIKAQCPIMIAQVNKVIIPEKPNISPNKQEIQPVKRIKLVYLIGYRLNDSLTLKRQLSPKPKIAPMAKLKKVSTKKSKTIHNTT